MADPILVAKGETELFLLPQMANRHGLIAGATGTGKTVSLQVLAEGLSLQGVSVFMADVKGDLAGISQPGSESNKKVMERKALLKLKDFSFEGYPVTFWDIFGEQGHAVRTTVSEMGPLILSRLFDLNDTQSGVLSLVFKIADDQGKIGRLSFLGIGGVVGQADDLFARSVDGGHKGGASIPAKTADKGHFGPGWRMGSQVAGVERILG